MGVSGGVWECGKPERFSIISIPQSEGEGGGDFLFKGPQRGRSLGSPFPLFSPAGDSPPQRIFFLLLFLLEVVL